MSINPEETELTSKSNDFAKAMGSFVQTDFQYFDYLRNRQRYYIGTKHVSTTSNVTPAKKLVEKPKGTDDGSGISLSYYFHTRSLHPVHSNFNVIFFCFIGRKIIFIECNFY